MKTRQRRSFSADMKARIALEAIKGQKTIQEIASHYSVYPNQVTNLKKQAVEGAAALFADRRSQPDVSAEALKADPTLEPSATATPIAGICSRAPMPGVW